MITLISYTASDILSALNADVALKVAFEGLDFVALVLAIHLFLTAWRGYFSTPGATTCVHGVVFMVERPMHQAVMIDTLFVPLGSLIGFVAHRLFSQQGAYAAWRLLWTMK